MQRLRSELFNITPIKPVLNRRVKYFRKKGKWPPRRNWPRRRWPSSIHVKVPMRNVFPTFKISSLLLDLDAVDSRYVRPYDERLDKLPEPSRADRDWQPVKERLAEFEERSKQYDQVFSDGPAADKFHTWRINDHDIMSVALAGVPPGARDVQRAELPSTTNGLDSENTIKAVLDWNGIPHIVRDDASKTTLHMLRRQFLVENRPLEEMDKVSFKKTLKGYQSFSDIERLVAYVLLLPRGYITVAFSIGTLVDACNRTASTGAPIRVLSFLNNVVQSLDWRENDMSAELSASVVQQAKKHLYVSAFSFAIQHGAFVMAQRYLLALRYGYKFHVSTKEITFKQILNSISSETESMANCISLDTVDRLLAIYGLLVGRVQGQSARETSLYDILEDPTDPTFQSFLTCLARLGAFRTMWYIWHRWRSNASDTLHPQYKSVFFLEKEVDSRDLEKWYVAMARVFTHAFHESIEMNGRILELARNREFVRAEKEFNKDCQLDMETIMRSKDIITSKDKVGISSSGLTYRGQIEEIFDQPDISKALSGLSDLMFDIQRRTR